MKRPYITIKFAQTLDGKIAAKDSSSRWISGPRARKFAHKLRAQNDAVLVGINTVLKDNPSLTTRFVKGKNPIRVVIDKRLRIPVNSKIVKTARRIKTIIVASPGAPKRKLERLNKKGVEFIILPASKSGNIDLLRIIRMLSKEGIKSILVEGGSRIFASFLKAKLADRIIAIISPKILGRGVESIGDLGIAGIKYALKLKLKTIKYTGRDIIYTAFISK